MPSNPRECWASDSEIERHLASGGGTMISPKLQQWAQGPAAQLLNLGVTLIAAIGVPVIGWVGARVIDELVTLNRAVSSIQQTNAASEQRTRSLETLGIAHSEALAVLRERSIRHEVVIERLEELRDNAAKGRR